ncbi:tripartite tricarboxylate transporter TctB family protein [Jannaschia pohangensis]|uniref:Tripartite tricarboxylate transporter TctB family protein n=1 Tax=Jannaschia pohangensis TaxID=390807 RepID=A0A1I3GXL0_9RHOB|nr:tripartite tricarboxylate transporter TctB family protein [Jannaschia pohangensis]SFI28096.1 Tripartite tricarboxylate transporter TctB family protein [Jannaschia pohangensis]
MKNLTHDTAPDAAKRREDETQSSVEPRGDEARSVPVLVAILGGVGLLALSLVFVIGGVELGVGTPRRLGTGAFPVLSGLTLAIICVGIILGDLRNGHLDEVPDWISFFAIGAALAIFAFVAERFGLVPAVFLATITASLPDRTLPWIGKAALGAGVSLASWGLFIGVLDLPFRAYMGF